MRGLKTLFFQVAGFVLVGMILNRFGTLGAIGAIAAKMLWHRKTSGMLRGILEGAAIGGGLAAAVVITNYVDQSDVLGRHEQTFLSPVQRALAGVA